MSGHYFQLTMDLDMWIGKVEAYYHADEALEEIWNRSRSQNTAFNTYVPFGVDALLRQLQTNSFFKNSLPVQRIDISSFTVDGGLKTIGNLTNFVRENAEPSPLAANMTAAIRNWLGVVLPFAAGTELAGMWNAVNNNNAVPFKTYGVEKLVAAVKGQPGLEDCGRVEDLDSIIFTNGSIKTAGEFHTYLLPCGRRL